MKFLPAKILASTIPDNVDRPPVEKVIGMVNVLLNEQKEITQNKLAKAQKKQNSMKLRLRSNF